MPRPPLPLSSAIVDPRVGDHGPALLALEDGTVFEGIAFGAPLAAGGDLVVNTSQTGYQEVCTDPSYAGQMVVMTYPLIGNYGRLFEDDQSRAPVAARADRRPSDGRGRRAGGPARGAAARRAASRQSPASTPARSRATCARPARSAAASARRVSWIGTPRSRPPGPCPRWEDQDFVGEVSPVEPYDVGSPADGGPLIAIVDLGLKTNIVRSLRRRGARVRVLPHTVDAAAVALAPDIDGLVLSPGPGDPARLDARSRSRGRRSTTGGRCSGSALATRSSGRAAGAETRRLRFGHHGANHPIRDLDTGLVQVTAQNHEVTVVADSLPARQRVPREPGQPQRRLGRGPAPRATCRSRPCSTTPRALPDRSMPWPCSTAS